MFEKFRRNGPNNREDESALHGYCIQAILLRGYHPFFLYACFRLLCPRTYLKNSGLMDQTTAKMNLLCMAIASKPLFCEGIILLSLYARFRLLCPWARLKSAWHHTLSLFLSPAPEKWVLSTKSLSQPSTHCDSSPTNTPKSYIIDGHIMSSRSFPGRHSSNSWGEDIVAETSEPQSFYEIPNLIRGCAFRNRVSLILDMIAKQSRFDEQRLICLMNKDLYEQRSLPSTHCDSSPANKTKTTLLMDT
ncbi:hypothetical protein CDAR_320891 [Caerostris darwini]|uniref:Uncharacterized protein n=1 Tax=Caerostris darwini TaxID=1538125 RepID=A0AAV4WZS2_9ARAC|nr:hypothetical protein CDAR_320891 [Caerostris darwini]